MSVPIITKHDYIISGWACTVLEFFNISNKLAGLCRRGSNHLPIISEFLSSLALSNFYLSLGV